MDKMEELERIARVATPGPWLYDFEPGYCGELIASNGTSIGTFVDEPDSADAAYIAAASPEVILRLVAIARAAEAVYERHSCGEVNGTWAALREALKDPQ